MYIFPEMIELGLPDKKKWKSPAHRKVAQAALLMNSRITSRQILMENVAIIQKISKERIKQVTMTDLFKLGVSVP